jgi:hypothetical protein
MKKALSFALVAASLLLASGAQAQEMRVKADVPFEFTINNESYPAGSYDIRQIGMNTATLLNVSLDGKMGSEWVGSNNCSSIEPASKTVLVFHRVGDEYFLYRIWVEGKTTGREFPQPKRETQLARNEKVQEIIVAANLAKK